VTRLGEGRSREGVVPGREGACRSLAVDPGELVVDDLLPRDVVADEIDEPVVPGSTSWKASSTSALMRR